MRRTAIALWLLMVVGPSLGGQTVDGLKVFGQAELEAGFLPDNLHPNADGYCKYAENYLREVMTLVDLPEETQTP